MNVGQCNVEKLVYWLPERKKIISEPTEPTATSSKPKPRKVEHIMSHTHAHIILGNGRKGKTTTLRPSAQHVLMPMQSIVRATIILYGDRGAVLPQCRILSVLYEFSKPNLNYSYGFVRV